MMDVARRALAESWAACISLAVLAPLLFMGVQSPFLAAAGVGIAVVLVLIVCFDLAATGTLFMLVGMFTAPLNDLRLGASYVTISDVVFVLGIGILIPTVLRNKIEVPLVFIGGFAILLTMGSVASAASAIPVVSFGQLARLVVGAFMLPIFFMLWKPPRATVVRLAGAYIFGTVFSVFYGLLQGPVAGDARYVGFTYHPNFLGLECLLAAALVPFVVGSIPFGRRWIFWGAGLICAYGIWLSGSRAALLVLGMLIFVYPFVERSIKAVGAIVFGVAMMLALSSRLVQEDSNNALGRLFGGGSANGSDIERRRILDAALAQFKAHPLLGVGFDGGLGSHNIYLQVATAVGVIGLLGYLLVLWTALRPLFWTGINHRLAYPALAYMAIGPLTNTLWDRLIWAVLALTLAVNIHRPPDPESSTIAEDTPRRALAEMRNPG